MTDKILVHPLAVSDHVGELSFLISPETDTGNTKVLADNDQGMLLKATTLDETFSEKNKNIFLKIDIEGHELEALKGGENLLRTNNCFLQIEIFPENVEAVLSFLKERGYTLVHQIEHDYYFSKAVP